MKVKIKPYHYRYTVGNAYDEKIYKKYKRYPMTPKMNRLEKGIVHFFNVVNWALDKTINKFNFWRSESRIKVRIDSHDTYSMDHTLAHIILPMLENLKQAKYFSMKVDNEDVPEELHSTVENPYDVDENHFKRCEYVMEKMIFAFSHIIDDDWEDAFYHGKPDYTFTAISLSGEPVNEDDYEGEILYQMNQGNSDYHVDWEGIKKIEEEIQVGLNLFGKYYRGLWW